MYYGLTLDSMLKVTPGRAAGPNRVLEIKLSLNICKPHACQMPYLLYYSSKSNKSPLKFLVQPGAKARICLTGNSSALPLFTLVRVVVVVVRVMVVVVVANET